MADDEKEAIEIANDSKFGLGADFSPETIKNSIEEGQTKTNQAIRKMER